MKIIGVIPARYKSSRFPGKPLVDIWGKPMIAYVYTHAKEVSLFAQVLVATDDNRIAEACAKHNLECIMTRSDHPTGTDRVAEVATRIPADLYVNIQGDEPMLIPKTIEAAIEPFLNAHSHGLLVTNLMTPITRIAEILDTGVPKVVVNEKGEAVFLSRLGIPYPKERRDITYFKQVCVYGFRPEALVAFSHHNPGPCERAEGIELLRFLEHGYKVQMVLVDSDTVAVDTPTDLELVRQLMKG